MKVKTNKLLNEAIHRSMLLKMGIERLAKLRELEAPEKIILMEIKFINKRATDIDEYLRGLRASMVIKQLL